MPRIGESLPWAPDSIWDGSGWINRSLWTGANVNGSNPAAANADVAAAYREKNEVALPATYAPPMPTGNVLQAPSPQPAARTDTARPSRPEPMPWPETWMPSRPRTPMVDYGYVRPPGHAPSWLPGTEAQRYAGHVQQTQPYSGWGGWGGMPQQQPSWSQRPMVPRPYHVNPMVWDSLGNVGQQLALGAAEQQGYDANDWLRQLNESRPQGQAPRRVRTQYAPSRGFGGF